MTRLVFFGWLVLGGALATFGFYVSDDVANLEKELQAVERAILEEQRAIHVMTAEWSYLNRPARIADLAERHLNLTPIGARRMVGLEDLPARQREAGLLDEDGGNLEEAPQ
jgi:hypothetical protein